MKKTSLNDLSKSLSSLYLDGQYNKARSELLANKNAYSKAQFHYNFGTLQLKQGQLPAAKYHLEKAIKNGAYNVQTFNNLKYTNDSIKVSDISQSKNPYDLFNNSLLSLPEFSYLALTLVLYILSLVFYKKSNITKLTLFILILFATSPYIVYQTYVANLSHAVSMQELTLREGPSKIYDEIKKVPPGAKFIITKTHQGWVYISNPDFLSGWVKRNKVGIL